MFVSVCINCIITDQDCCILLGTYFLLLVFAKICFCLYKKKKKDFLGKDNVELYLKEHKGKKCPQLN